MVQDATSKMLADLKAIKNHSASKTFKFHNALNTIVGPVVDAEGITSIMTVKDIRARLRLRRCRRSENFKKGLFQFYGNAPAGIQQPGHYR